MGDRSTLSSVPSEIFGENYVGNLVAETNLGSKLRVSCHFTSNCQIPSILYHRVCLSTAGGN